LASAAAKAAESASNPTVLGFACNDDFYVSAWGVAGAVAGYFLTRGRAVKELAKVIVMGAADKAGEKFLAPHVCETLLGTPKTPDKPAAGGSPLDYTWTKSPDRRPRTGSRRCPAFIPRQSLR